jgi:hypothetical protein
VTIRYRRVVVPGAPVNRLATVREEVPREAPPPPLPLRAEWTPPPPPTRHERILAVVTPRRPVNVPRVPRAPGRVTAAQLRQARDLKRLGQRELAARLHCARSTIAAAEQGDRPILPNVEEWVEAVLREHGEWPAEDEPEGGDHADDADEPDEGATEADGGTG